MGESVSFLIETYEEEEIQLVDSTCFTASQSDVQANIRIWWNHWPGMIFHCGSFVFTVREAC